MVLSMLACDLPEFIEARERRIHYDVPRWPIDRKRVSYDDLIRDF